MGSAIYGIFLCALIAAVGMAFGWPQLRPRLARLHLPRRRRRTRCGEVVDGRRACVTGRVVTLAEQLASPISGAPCVYHHVIAWALHDGERVAVLREDEQGCAFVLRDDTGDLLVPLDGSPRVQIHPISVVHVSRIRGALITAGPKTEHLGAELPVSRLVALSERWAWPVDYLRGLLFEEAVIRIHDRIDVTGRVELDVRAGGEPFRAPTVRGVFARGTVLRPLVIGKKVDSEPLAISNVERVDREPRLGRNQRAAGRLPREPVRSTAPRY